MKMKKSATSTCNSDNCASIFLEVAVVLRELGIHDVHFQFCQMKICPQGPDFIEIGISTSCHQGW